MKRIILSVLVLITVTLFNNNLNAAANCKDGDKPVTLEAESSGGTTFGVGESFTIEFTATDSDGSVLDSHTATYNNQEVGYLIPGTFTASWTYNGNENCKATIDITIECQKHESFAKTLKSACSTAHELKDQEFIVGDGRSFTEPTPVAGCNSATCIYCNQEFEEDHSGISYTYSEDIDYTKSGEYTVTAKCDDSLCTFDKTCTVTIFDNGGISVDGSVAITGGHFPINTTIKLEAIGAFSASSTSSESQTVSGNCSCDLIGSNTGNISLTVFSSHTSSQTASESYYYYHTKTFKTIGVFDHSISASIGGPNGGAWNFNDTQTIEIK